MSEPLSQTSREQRLREVLRQTQLLEPWIALLRQSYTGPITRYLDHDTLLHTLTTITGFPFRAKEYDDEDLSDFRYSEQLPTCSLLLQAHFPQPIASPINIVAFNIWISALRDRPVYWWCSISLFEEALMLAPDLANQLTGPYFRFRDAQHLGEALHWLAPSYRQLQALIAAEHWDTM
jgi:hypothetical protein